MTVFEYDGRLLVVDCGVLFPEDDQPGVDLILPDFDYIRDRLDQVDAIVLTHGHEDHIGAVPYLLREKPDIPLRRLAAHAGAGRGQARRAPDQALHPGGRGRAAASSSGRSTASSSRSTTRSRTRSRWRSARRPAWCCTPATSRWTSCRWTGASPTCAAFARLGEEGVDLFLVDSTNAEVPGFTTPERDIGPVLDRVFATAQRRVIVACFASHVHRVQQVLDAADAARAQGRLRRPVDGAQHGHRPRPRLPARPRRPHGRPQAASTTCPTTRSC